MGKVVTCINNFIHGYDDRQWNRNGKPSTFANLTVGNTYEVLDENEIQYKLAHGWFQKFMFKE